MRSTWLLLGIFALQADELYVPSHTSHFRVHRDKNNQEYTVEMPVEEYAIDDPQLSVPPAIVPPKPTTYYQEGERDLSTSDDDQLPEPTFTGEYE